MTSMADKCVYSRCSSYFNDYLEATSIGVNITKQMFLLKYVFSLEIMILTPKIVDKWPPGNHFEMLDLEDGWSSKFNIP